MGGKRYFKQFCVYACIHNYVSVCVCAVCGCMHVLCVYVCMFSCACIVCGYNITFVSMCCVCVCMHCVYVHIHDVMYVLCMVVWGIATHQTVFFFTSLFFLFFFLFVCLNF